MVKKVDFKKQENEGQEVNQETLESLEEKQRLGVDKMDMVGFEICIKQTNGTCCLMRSATGEIEKSSTT